MDIEKCDTPVSPQPAIKHVADSPDEGIKDTRNWIKTVLLEGLNEATRLVKPDESLQLARIPAWMLGVAQVG